MSNRVTATLEWLAALAALGVRGGLDITIEAAPEEYNEWLALAHRPTTVVSITRGHNANKLELWGPGGSRVVILEVTGDEE